MDDPPLPIVLPPVPHPPPLNIHDAARNRSIPVFHDDGTETTELAYLIWDSPNVEQAYQRWPGRPALVLEGRGTVVWAQVLLREKGRKDGRVVFRRSETTVVIKRLHRMVIDPPLQRQLQGGDPLNENPYAEISVMQQHGNYEHIYGCYEALLDRHCLYIVTLQARGGALFEHVHFGGYAPQDDVPRLARQLVRNLDVLQQRHLVHRDLKPENVLVAVHPWVPFTDFAMTLQIPYLEGWPQKIAPQGAAGTRFYISPEVLQNEPFDHKADVWALGIILFNLLTGVRLWEIPWGEDESYSFFIIQGGLENEALCDRRLEQLFQNGGEGSLLSMHIQVVQVLSSVARNLLQKLLSHDPRNRPEVHEIINHQFFHGVA